MRHLQPAEAICYPCKQVKETIWVVTRMTCDTHRHDRAAVDALQSAVLRLRLQLRLVDALADVLG
jgi:hypothetical protein